MTTIADRYELGDVLGVGGAAVVHRATDLRLGRPVAVKVLDDRAARSADPAARERFLREASTSAQLTHPHLVTVYDAGTDDDLLYLVMELVDGESLAELLARSGPLPVEQAVSIATQLLDALTVVHAQGFVHRDVKPANVLVDRSGRIRLADFGIAKRFDEVESSLTSEATVVGTPTYLAPEQAAGHRLGPATDVYLVGLVLFEMLTGDRAPAGGGPLDVSGRRTDVPPHVTRAVERATAPDPSARFADALEMAVALDVPGAGLTSVLLVTPPTDVMPVQRPAAGAAAAVAAGAAVGAGLDAGVDATVDTTGDAAGGAPVHEPLDTTQGADHHEAVPVVSALVAPPVEPVRHPGARPPRRSDPRRWLGLGLIGVALLAFVAVLANPGGTDVPDPSAPGPSTVPVTEPVTVPTTLAPATTAPVVVAPAPPDGDDDDRGNGNGNRNEDGNGNGKKDD